MLLKQRARVQLTDKKRGRAKEKKKKREQQFICFCAETSGKCLKEVLVN